MDDAVIDECCTLQYSNFMCLFSTWNLACVYWGALYKNPQQIVKIH